MPRIVVVKAFTLNTVDAVKHEFAVGIHEVEQWVADHWFTKAHLATADDVAKLKAEADALAEKAQAAADAAAALVEPTVEVVEAAAVEAETKAPTRGKAAKDSAADVL